MKYCYYCKITKEEICFSKNKSKKDGLTSECKDCIKILNKIQKDKNSNDVNYKIKLKEKNKEYNSKNKEIIKERNKEYHSKNKEHCKEKRKEYFKEYRFKNKEKKKEYDLKNKEKSKVYKRKYELNNKEKINKNKRSIQKNRRLNDPAYKLRRNCSGSINRYLKLNNSSKNNNSILDYLPSPIEEIKNHLENLFDPWMNWDNHGKYNAKTWDDNDPITWTWQLDHIIPQSKLPYTSMEDDNFKKCWSLENLRPLSAKQNIIEGNRR